MCSEIADLIEGYAVGALDEDQMLLVASRISDCPNQQEQLRQYEETIGLLGLAAGPIEPPAALWNRLRGSTHPQPVPEPIALPAWRREQVVLPRWLAAALAAAAVLLLVSAAGLGMALRDATRDEPMFDSTMATYLTSGGKLVPLASQPAPEYLGWNGRGSLLVAPGMPPMVVVDNCVPSSEGYVYVVWLQRDEQRTPMGIIEIGKDGRGVMKLEGVTSLEGYDVLGISIRTSADNVYDVITGPPTRQG